MIRARLDAAVTDGERIRKNKAGRNTRLSATPCRVRTAQTAARTRPRGRQTAITVTDFVTRYGSSASGPPSDP